VWLRPGLAPRDRSLVTVSALIAAGQVAQVPYHLNRVMGIGLFAPPFGVGYYAACAISRIHPDEGMRPILGYILALIIGLAVVAAVPWISIGFLG
jgi:TRAP-type C4-dicarboxylate transport system permease large subunit